MKIKSILKGNDFSFTIFPILYLFLFIIKTPMVVTATFRCWRYIDIILVFSARVSYLSEKEKQFFFFFLLSLSFSLSLFCLIFLLRNIIFSILDTFKSNKENIVKAPGSREYDDGETCAKCWKGVSKCQHVVQFTFFFFY